MNLDNPSQNMDNRYGYLSWLDNDKIIRVIIDVCSN